MFLIILGFLGGVFVGYKYPQQVDQAVQAIKNAVNDLKDKFSKKPPKGDPRSIFREKRPAGPGCSFPRRGSSRVPPWPSPGGPKCGHAGARRAEPGVGLPRFIPG